MGQHHLGHSVIKRSSVISKGEAAIAGMVFMSIYDFDPYHIHDSTTAHLSLGQGACYRSVRLGAITCSWSTHSDTTCALFPDCCQRRHLFKLGVKETGEMIQNADVVFVNAQEERVRRDAMKKTRSRVISVSQFGHRIWAGSKAANGSYRSHKRHARSCGLI